VNQRKITITIMAPVVVEMIVTRSKTAGPEDPWEVKTIMNAEFRGTMTPRVVNESTNEDDTAEIDRLANAAPEYRPGGR
jgi:hypothetical protein